LSKLVALSVEGSSRCRFNYGLDSAGGPSTFLPRRIIWTWQMRPADMDWASRVQWR